MIDGDRCADCATDATGAGCSPRRRGTSRHYGSLAVRSADDAEMALGDTAAGGEWGGPREPMESMEAPFPPFVARRAG